MTGTQGPGTISTKQLELTQRAQAIEGEALTTLSHFIDPGWLREAYRRTRKDGASGVDGQTAKDYERELDRHLGSLLERFKSGEYRAPPVKRVYIPKADGKRLRPIGIPTLEDKVLQRAVVMLLEPIYEAEFSDSSYGFRPGRSAHQALEAVWRGTMGQPEGWLIELDIENFFDAVDHKKLQELVARRVGDGVIRRMIGKWLNAGVMEEGRVRHPAMGTPQGGVISPLLANLYLDEVLDRWFERVVMPRLRGKAFLVRYADDAVLGFAREEDARRVMRVLAKRFEKYGLSLHPEKTRLIPFKKTGPGEGPRGGPGVKRSFDFLGFTHYWGPSRKGQPVVRRKTAKARLSRALRSISQWCRRYRHEPVPWQHAQLGRKLQGHYAYYGITGNGGALVRFLHAVERIWWKWLSRRSNRAKLLWERFAAFLKRCPLPPIRVVHSVYRSQSLP